MSRLTEEMVIARSKQSDLSTIKKLNCWGSELSDVSIIRRMLGVELLALSVNRVSTLADFENCVKLQELYLRKNNIQDINDLVYLQQLPNLRHLWLEENPCVEKAGPNYRQIVLRALPNLQKLDNIDVTPDELAEAMRGATLQEDDAYEDTYNDHGSQQNLSPAQQQQQPLQHSPPSQHQAQSQQHPAQANYQQQTQYSQQQTSPQQMYHQQPPTNQRQQQQQQQQQQPEQQQQAPPPPQQQQQQQQQWRPNSPNSRETGPASGSQASPDITEDSISESIERGSMPTSPQQRTSPNHEYSPAEPKFSRDQHRHSYHQPSYDRSPGSDHGSPMMGYRDRRAMAPSMSMHSMKDYYQSDRPTPPFYRHSQTDLTEWEEEHNPHHHQPSQQSGNHQSTSSSSHHNQQQQPQSQPHSRHSYAGHSHQNGNGAGPTAQHRRSIGPGEQREPYQNGGAPGGGGYSGGGSGGRNGSAASLHNGSKDKEDWEEAAGDRGRRGDGRPRRPESRFNDNASVMSSAVINHYASFHRRPVNRSSNLLSAALCLVKELDYPSLEVIEQVVRCRIDELSAD